jgi:molybdopterin converting factor small subunit
MAPKTSEPSTGIQVTVRYFAAARAAAATEFDSVVVDHGTTIADLVGQLAGRNGQLGKVLARCSFLCDGVAVRDSAATLQTGQTIDVLPPFAGG